MDDLQWWSWNSENHGFQNRTGKLVQYLRMTWCISDMQIIHKVVALRASLQIHLNQKPVFHPKILQLKWPRKASLLTQSKWNSEVKRTNKSWWFVSATPNSSHVLCVCMPNLSKHIFLKKPQGAEQIHLCPEGLLGMLSCKEDKSPADSWASHLNVVNSMLSRKARCPHSTEAAKKFYPASGEEWRNRYRNSL